MALRTIRVNDDPCLKKVCREVTVFDDRLAELLDDMFDTMYNANGVGLAGPQVGVLRRLCVIDCSEDRSQPLELINPVILESSGIQGDFEGCLSFPGQSGYVERALRVRFEGYDRNGDLYEYEAEGFLARAVQHELDHLDGLTWQRLKKNPPKGFEDGGYIDEDGQL